MADSNWLRLLSGPRSRTPAKPTNSASPPLESSASTIISQQGNPQQPKQDEQQNEQPTGTDAEAIPQRRSHSGHSKALSRLPSWPALSQASTTPAAPKSSTPDLFVREADRVAHNPSMDHIVDTLLAAVMSKPALEPLGPEYGSSILHLIEAYAAAKKETSKAQNKLSRAVERRQKENEEFDTLVTEWTIREARYKAEIKRLEIIIHRTSGSGLEAVSMARSGSLIRRGSRNVTGDQNISPTDLGNHRRGTTDRGVFKTEASAPRHRDSLIGRPRILDPKSDVTLSMKIDKEPLADNVTSIIQTHATIREVPSTPSSKTSPSSSSSDAHGSTKRSSGPALERDQVLSGSPSLAAEKQRHQREFSFVESEDSHMVTQDEVDISDTHSRNENATVKSPHTPLGAVKKDEEQCTTNICTTAPGAGEVPPDGMNDELPQLRRSKETAQRRFGGKIDADGKAYL